MDEMEIEQMEIEQIGLVPSPLDEEDANEGTIDCICEEEWRFVDYGFMICCDTCHAWFHGDCVGILSNEQSPETWHCPRCAINVDTKPSPTDPTAKRQRFQGEKYYGQAQAQSISPNSAKQLSLTNFKFKPVDHEQTFKEMAEQAKIDLERKNQQKMQATESPLTAYSFRTEGFTLADIDLSTLEGKIEYARRMRLAVTNPEMIDQQGNLNPDYFKPKKKAKKVEKWNEEQKEALFDGIFKHGIGAWKEIKGDFPQLAHLEVNELRVKTCHLVGRQNLQDYKGWKATREQMTQERQGNEQLGRELGCWKAGTLVADDEGKVAQRLQEIGGRFVQV